MLRVTAALLGALLSTVRVAAVGCSADDQPNVATTTGGAGGGVGGETAAGAAGGGQSEGGMNAGGAPCATHDNDAPEVTLEQVASDMPAPIGGPIAPGKYHLTSWIRYTGSGGMVGPTSSKWKETAVWSVTDLQTVLDAYDGDGERKIMFAYDLGAGTGMGFDLTVLCPESLSIPWNAYSADHDAVVLYSTTLNMEWTYTPLATP
jgi:hypothetical protein